MTNLRLPDLGAAGFRAIGRWLGGFIGGRLLRGTALGFFRNMRPQLVELSGRVMRGFAFFRFGTNDAGRLISRCGH